MPKRRRPEDEPLRSVTSRDCRSTDTAACAATAAIRGRNVDDKTQIINLELDNALNRAFHDRPVAGDRCSVAAEAERREIRKLRSDLPKGVPSEELPTSLTAQMSPELPDTFDRATRVAALSRGPHTSPSIDMTQDPGPDRGSENNSMRRLFRLFSKTPAWANFGNGLEAYLARVSRFLRIESADSTHLAKFLIDILDRILQADLALVSSDRPVKEPASLPPLPPLSDDEDDFASRADPGEPCDSERLNSDHVLPEGSPGLLRPETAKTADHVAKCARHELRAQPPSRHSVDLVVNTMLRWRWRHEAAKVVGGELSLQQLLDGRRESREASPAMRTPAKKHLRDGDEVVVSGSSNDDDNCKNVAADTTCKDFDSSWMELLRKEQTFKTVAAHSYCPGAKPWLHNLSPSDDGVSLVPQLGLNQDPNSAMCLGKLAPRLRFICSKLSASNDTIISSLYETRRDLVATKDKGLASIFEVLETLEVPLEPFTASSAVHTPTKFLDRDQQAFEEIEAAPTGARSSPVEWAQSSFTDFSPFPISFDDTMLLSNALVPPAGGANSPWTQMAAQKFDVVEAVDEFVSSRSNHINDSKAPDKKTRSIQLHGRTVKVKVAPLMPKISSEAPKPQRITVADDGDGSRNVGKTPHNAKFPGKLHKILTTMEYKHIIAWDDTFSGIVVKDKDLFLKQIMPDHFNSSAPGDEAMKTFYRQLNYYGFQSVKDVRHDLKVKPIEGARYFVNRDASIKSVHHVTQVLRYTPRHQGCQKSKQHKKRRRS